MLVWCKCVNHSYLVSREVRMTSGRRWRILAMTWVSLTGSVENDEVCHMNPQVLFRLFEDSAVILHGVSLVQIVSESGLSVIIFLFVNSASCSFKLFNILHTSACYRRSPAVMLTAVAHVCPHRPKGHADRRHQVPLILLQVPKVKAR